MSQENISVITQDGTLRRSNRESRPSKNYEDFDTSTAPVSKANKQDKGTAHSRTDSRSKRDATDTLLEASSGSSKGGNQKGYRKQKDQTTKFKGSTSSITSEVGKHPPNDICAVCEENSEHKLSCSRCQGTYCLQCLQISEQSYNHMISVQGFCWLCRDCVTPGIKCMRQDKEIEERCADYFNAITTRIDKLESDVSSKPSKVEVENLIRQELKRSANTTAYEVEERDKRRLNLIVFNQPESEQADPNERQSEDIAFFEDKCTTHLDTTISITKASRLGKKDSNITKPRPLRITLLDERQKKQILRNASTLKDVKNDDVAKNLFINPDLTPIQQKLEKELRAELKKKRKDEQDPTVEWIIRSGQIISRTRAPRPSSLSGLSDEEEGVEA